MATIIKRENKNGICYKVQVKIKDKGSGEIVVKSTTWKPPDGMGLRQQTKEVNAFAEAYETQIRQTVEAGVKVAKCEMTFKEFAEEWLTKTKEQWSLSYYVGSKTIIELVNRYMADTN